MFTWLRLFGIGASAIALWYAYGWGSQVITNYGDMAKKIERLERDKRLINSRVASYQTLLARHKAAAKASKCGPQIEKWVKDPNSIPTPFDPFNQLD